jgi:predicted Zn-dependent protease
LFVVKNMRLRKVAIEYRFLVFVCLALWCFSLVIFSPAASFGSLPDGLPALQVRALPPVLADWQDATNSGDYFDRVKPPNVGHLLWSKFPIKVYVQPPVNTNKPEDWVEVVFGVVREWGVYLPLVVVDNLEVADIRIVRQAPPLRQELRARSGEAVYELYVGREGDKNVLSHRFTVYLNPNQVGKYVAAVARHEFGHALGIWGHSSIETDVLYFSQVRNPPPISARDVNTLKRIYQQPTRLGWEF